MDFAFDMALAYTALKAEGLYNMALALRPYEQKVEVFRWLGDRMDSHDC